VDQAPHIEFAREVVRSFNFRYGKPVLVEPEMKVTEVPKVLGTDGQQKMGKSLNNHIELAASDEETVQRVMTMVTDPQRLRRNDPGRPEVCNVFSMHRVFSPAEQVASIDLECRRAGIGCVDCKRQFAANLNAQLAPFRQKRAALSVRPNEIWEILREGEQRARTIARATMAEVRDAVGLP
jgi:tryptophanyl-tRNA synthetase